MLNKNQKKLIQLNCPRLFLVIISGILLATLLVVSVQMAYAYVLRVNSYDGTNSQVSDGVDFTVRNLYSNAVAHLDYTGIPPENTYYHFDDFDMPPNSSVNVCASDDTTGDIINCQTYVTGYSANEVVYFDLNP